MNVAEREQPQASSQLAAGRIEEMDDGLEAFECGSVGLF